MRILVATTEQRNEWFAGYQAVDADTIYDPFCRTCYFESHWQGSSGNMYDHVVIGIAWLPARTGRKSHATCHRLLPVGKTLCGRAI